MTRTASPGCSASTLHRLLGWRPDSRVRFRHHRANRLPYDVVVVDETSMVSLTMMARLLDAMRPDARLVLVGDPDQLASVEAGAVLADLVDGFAGFPDSPVAALLDTHRYGQQIGALAQALRTGEADDAMAALHAGSDEVELVDPDDEVAMAGFRSRVTDVAVELRVAAERGDAEAALDASRSTGCCAPTARVPTASAAGTVRSSASSPSARGSPTTTSGTPAGRSWSPPTTTTSLLNNGDMGVTIRPAGDAADGRLRVVVQVGSKVREFATTRLSGVETVHAMTVHKSQGSQAAHGLGRAAAEEELATASTRELFYTAVTRAQETGARRRHRGLDPRGDRPRGAARERPGSPAAGGAG